MRTTHAVLSGTMAAARLSSFHVCLCFEGRNIASSIVLSRLRYDGTQVLGANKIFLKRHRLIAFLLQLWCV